jgi:multicomponent Na+:H+ antiporter subunit G
MIVLELASATFMVIGAVFMFVAGLGIVRMPDLYLRMSASTKAATLGVSSVLVATAIYFNDLGITGRSAAIIAFLLLTAPVAAHMIGRAAYITGVPLWERTAHNELKGRYDERTHDLTSPADASKLEETSRLS